ncbi:unnamed protein product [Caenorhabditis auriculariae]|uniref:Uncharacterized protein n=1 Tax=Caenorhabditis auriculariae TaxID=2777116 RepID=A0A8S1HJD4_9PELO|nr:unnamed protein product [Caenorhabditis auriculariae]
MLTYDEIDAIFETDRVKEAYDELKKRYNEGERSVDLLWRLARLCHEVAYRSPKNIRKELIFEGKDYACEAHAIDANHFEAVRWAAILTGQSTDYLGTKEKIEQGGHFKNLLDEALAMEPNEFSLLHLRGRFNFTIANLSWLERKAATMLYSAPPKATIEEALEDFEAAYHLQSDWLENLYYLAKCLQIKGEKNKAKKYLNEALALPTESDVERELIGEARHLLGKC